MEWVETTGRSVQEAKEAALDELGVDEADAEFEVLAEAQTGLFGRLRSEARVRARVRPTAPRAKEERRDRRDRRRKSGSAAGGTAGGTVDSGVAGTADADEATGGSGAEAEAVGSAPAASRSSTGRSRSSAGDSPTDEAPTSPGDEEADGSSGGTEPDTGSGTGPTGPSSGGTTRRRNRRRGGKRPAGGSPSEARMAELDEAGADDVDEGKGPQVEVALERQAEVASEFLTQLTAEFGLSATVTVVRPDDDTVELQLSGSDLGILIGPKGATLLAIQNLTRTVVFNETGANNGHINVDVGGYRQKRSEALARFATQIADRVKQSGDRTVLEPMSAVDRKVVHDTIASIDGVSTISEGEEPRRRVVVLPD